MKRGVLTFIISILVSSSYCGAYCQQTSLSATITDSTSQVWANGSYNITFIPTPGQPGPFYWQGARFTPQVYQGTMNGAGTLSVTLPDNSTITPAGSQWAFVLCSNTTAPCSTVKTAVTGATEDLSTFFSARVTPPVIYSAPMPRAYSSSEVAIPAPTQGGQFYQVVSNIPYFWSGTQWISLAGAYLPLSGPSLIWAQSGASLSTLCTGFTGTVEVTVPLTVSTTTVLPSTCGLDIKNGGSITIASGQYLQISGPFSAPLTQVFFGDMGVFFYGNAGTLQIYPQWFGATGNAIATGVSCTASSTTLAVQGYNPFDSSSYVGSPVEVLGCGSGGANLSTTITAVASGTITVQTAPSTTAGPVGITNEDDTAALSAWTRSVQGALNSSLYSTNSPGVQGIDKLYCPRGSYTASTPVNVFSGADLEGEFSNVQNGCIFIQINSNSSLFNVIADNGTPTLAAWNATGTWPTINGGNGNNVFRQFKLTSAYVNDNQLNAPIVNFQNAWNNVSDTEIDHVVCQDSAGACWSVGFQTTGSITADSTTLTLANGSTFRCGGNYGGAQVTVVGAGAAGANLSTYCTAGGGTNTLTLATAASTTVSDAVVYPTTDTYGLKFIHDEFDVDRGAVYVQGNASGSIWFDDQEAYSLVRPFFYSSTYGDMDLKIDGLWCDGCGNANNGTTAYQYAIYDVDNGSSQGTQDALIQNSRFFSLYSPINLGGSIYVGNRNTFKLVNVNMYGADSTINDGKYVVAYNNNRFALQDSTLISNTQVIYTDARMVDICCENTQSAEVTGNHFINTGSSAFEYFIDADYIMSGTNSVFENNQFVGPVTTIANTNITNGIRINAGPEINGTVVTWSGAPPSTGTWSVGDIIYNTSPSSGGIFAWVCTTAGTPGTWSPEYLNNGPLPTPPAGAIYLSNLQSSTGGGYGTWTQCNTNACSGSSADATGTNSVTFGITSPSLSGDAMEIEQACSNCASPNNYVFNTLTYLHLGCLTISGGCNRSLNTNFLEDFYLYIPTGNAGVQAWEYDPDLFDGTNQYLASQQCTESSGMWSFWDEANGAWRQSSYPCPLYNSGDLGEWHHYQIAGYFDQVNETYTYTSFVLDGQTVYANLGQSFGAAPVSGSDYNVQFQIGSSTGVGTGANIEYIDELQEWLW